MENTEIENIENFKEMTLVQKINAIDAIIKSQLATLNDDTPTRLSANGPPLPPLGLTISQ